VWSFVVIILNPEGNPVPGFFKKVELCPLQKLVQNGFPEPFNFDQCHGVVGPRTDMFHSGLFKFLFKMGDEPPIGTLPAVVC
jgi:hypothetical protein